MLEKFVAFDIEIAKPLPEGETDWKAHRPLGIACAATDGDGVVASYYGEFYEADDDSVKYGFAPEMEQDDLHVLIENLQWCVAEGYKIVTWNGLGFDFDILAEESGLFEECRALALDHVDLMFQFFCLRGHAVGLDAVARGMGMTGKPDGVDGSVAPILWQRGQHETVLDYVAGDARMTRQIAETVAKLKRMNWISRSRRFQSCSFPHGLMTVRECLQLPTPDTSWMTDPWPRSRFVEWMKTIYG